MAWRGDGSEQLAVEGGEVRNTGGKKANAIWVDGDGGAGEWTWTVGQSGSGGLWVGVAEEARFGPGYQLKGLMFGGPGNLSDGSSLVTGNWGPKLQPGDTLDMRLEVAGSSTTLSFCHNKKPLGAAFEIANWAGEALRPVVSLTSKDQAITIAPSSLPADHFTLRSEPGEGGVEGRWSGENLEVRISKESPTSWGVSATVANTISATVSLTEDGRLTVGPLRTTLVAPPPHLQTKEAAFSQLLSQLTKLTREGSNLLMVGEDNLKLTLTPAIPLGPATKEKIRWLN